MTRRRQRRRERGSRFGGFVFLLYIGFSLVAAGGWFALASLGMPAPSPEKMWPVFPIWGGSLFLLGYLLNTRNFGLVLPGSAAMMVGLFLFPFAVERWPWDRMESLWPVFPLIGGLAFVAMWMASFARYMGLLVPACLGLATGVVGLGFTASPLSGVLTTIGWPVALLAVGAGLLMMGIFGVVLRSLRLLFGLRETT